MFKHLRSFGLLEYFVALSALAAIAAGLHTVSRMSVVQNQHVPLVQLTANLKLKTHSAYFWFDKARHNEEVDLERQVYLVLDLSLGLCQSLQLGSSAGIRHDLRAANDASLVPRFIHLCDEIRLFKALTEALWAGHQGKAPTREVAVAYEGVFGEITRMAEGIEGNTGSILVRDHSTLDLATGRFALIFLVLLVSMLVLVVRNRRLMEQKNTTLRTQMRELSHQIMERQRAEEALMNAKENLELTVQERTLELSKSNDLLQEDVGVRKRAEEALRGSQERLAGILEIAEDAIISVDERQCITLFNQGAERMFGYSPEEVLGQPLEMLLPERFRQAHGRHIIEFRDSGVRSKGKEGRAGIYGLHKDGSEFPAEGSISRLDWQGENIYTVILQNVAERKHFEEALQRQAVELSRSNTELEQFAYVASHDLQEPLRMVSSYTQLLAKRYKNKLDCDADEFIGFAVDGAMRMQNLISDLLSYSRVGTRGGEFEPLDCEELLAQVLSDFRIRLEETEAQVTHDPLPTVMADARQLQQVFQNLISNALKFSEGKPPVVHIGVEEESDQWRFFVRDEGIGIDLQYADRIFIIFQRLHGVGDYPGTGIGLAICKKIIDRHGGRIWVKSSPGEGSSFYFTLPKSPQGENA